MGIDSLPTIVGVAPPRSPAHALDPHEGAARLSSDLINAISRFPDDNPNPVMRFDADGHLIYANPASAGILQALGVAVGERLPAEVIARFEAVAPSPWLRGDRGGEPDLRGLAGAHPRPRLHQPLRHGRDRRAGHRQVPRPEPEPGLAHSTGTARSSTPTRRAPVSWPVSGWPSGTVLPADLLRGADGARPGGRRARPSRSRPAAAPTRCCRWTSPSSGSSTSTAPTSRRRRSASGSPARTSGCC